jgi:hypothetical protein
MLDKMKQIFLSILNFLGCLISSKCEFSIKKFLSYFFTILIFYLVIFTDKQYYDLLLFLGVLLGMREYSKTKYYENNNADEPRKEVSGFK